MTLTESETAASLTLVMATQSEQNGKTPALLAEAAREEAGELQQTMEKLLKQLAIGRSGASTLSSSESQAVACYPVALLSAA